MFSLMRSCGRKVCVCRNDLINLHLRYPLNHNKINQIKKDKKGCSGSYKVMLNNLEKVNWTTERYANHKFFMW